MALSFDTLSDGSLVLTLRDGCIERTAKHAHSELAHALIAGTVTGPAMEAAAELLERFLSATTFGALRAEHCDLANATGKLVRLSRAKGRAVRCEVVVSR